MELHMELHTELHMELHTRLVTSFRVPEGLSFDKVRPSWRLGGRHLIHLLRAFSNEDSSTQRGGTSGGGG